MPTYQRPGVYVEEFLTPSYAPFTPSTSTGVFLASDHNRGPTTPTKIGSWTEYRKHFGEFTDGTNLPYAVYQFFNNGGRVAYVKRVVGTGSVLATRTLNDRAGTPVPTLRVDAKNAGTWGNSIYVEIRDITNLADKFALYVYYGGATSAYLVETWTDLSMLDTDSRYVEKIVNDTNLGSSYITVVDLDSATAAPGDRPAVQAPTVLAGGANGAAPTSTEVTAATADLDLVTEPFILNLPGETSNTILTSYINYASDRGDVFVVVDPPAGDTVTGVTSYAASLPPVSYGAVYYPRVYIADPAATGIRSTKLVPPGGSVVGRFAYVDATRGVHKTPAGIDTRIAGSIALEKSLTAGDLDTLNQGAVNAIRHIPGSGVVIMGGRTLKPTVPERFISTRRSLIYIKKALLDSTAWATFEPNDPVLWSALGATIESFLLGFWQAGGLRGVSPQEAFYVKCDGTINPPEVVAQGEVRAEVGVALQFPAEFVVIRIGRWEGGFGTATEITPATP